MDVTEAHINQFLSKCKAANWSGVFYSAPFKNEFEFLLQDLNSITPSSSTPFIFYPFNNQLTPGITIQAQYKNATAIAQLAAHQNAADAYWQLPFLQNTTSTTKNEYEINFKKYQQSIQSGYCSKAILSTIVKHPIPTELNLGAYVLQLRQAYPQAFIYILSSPITGTWIGATPETLLKWDTDGITTMSLAGTRKKGAEEFKFGEKEKAEQQIVTQYIADIFEEKFGNANVQTPEEFGYGEMVHLISKISAKPADQFTQDDFMNLVQQLHPTPAVGGYPKQKAIELIQSTENHSRFYYSGYLGPVHPQLAEIAVNLRCMCITEEYAFAYAGGGITAESAMEAEWAETRLKANALLKFL